MTTSLYPTPNPTPWYSTDAEALELLREMRTALNALVAQGVLAQVAVQDTARAHERLQALLDFIYETRRRHERGEAIELDAVWARLSVDLCQLLEYCGGPANRQAMPARTHTGALAPSNACRIP
jgi:hypothetical protein